MNPLLGIFYHAVGGFCSRKFLYPIQTRSKLGLGSILAGGRFFLPGSSRHGLYPTWQVPDLGVLLTSIPLKKYDLAPISLAYYGVLVVLHLV